MLLADFVYRQFIHWPPAPTWSFEGKTIIVTGSNVGLGFEASRMLVRLGASQVILACRNIDKGKAAAKDIQKSTSCSAETLRVMQLDMSSYASVIAFVDKIKAEVPRLDALIANAGIGTRKFKTIEGNEETITTNVISTALLAFLLHPKLQETAVRFDTQTHLTLTASELYEVAAFKERNVPEGQIFATLNNKEKANMGDRYNVTKLLNIFIVKQMAVLSPLGTSNVIVNCVAPGFCQSQLFHSDFEGSAVLGAVARVFTRLCARPTEIGARTLVYGVGVGPESHGQYVPDCEIKETKGLTKGQEGVRLQSMVWTELKAKLEDIQKGVTNLEMR